MGEGQGPDKERLRDRMRGLRRSVPAEERAGLARALEHRLFSLPEMEAAGTVLLFYSFGSEVETSGMAVRIHDSGRRLLLPYLGSEGMEAAEVRPGDPLVETDYGPREPARRVAVDPDEVDLVGTPGLAFDREGWRLGYGGGHYDRYLARLRPVALRVGLGFGFQLLDAVPHEPGDERVHVVVTETGTIDCRGSSEDPRL